jgi:hypothetical protein
MASKRIDARSFGRTGPVVVRSCGCDVLPWEPCQHAREPVHAPSVNLRVALAFHEAYERLAPLNGYETRKETRHFDPRTANGKTMLAVCMELLQTGIIEPGPSL